MNSRIISLSFLCLTTAYIYGMERGDQTTLDGANTTALSTRGLQDPNTARAASDNPDHVATTKKPATDAHGAANSRFSRFLGLCTTLGGAVANTRLVTAPARAVQGVSSRVAKLIKRACNVPVKAGQTVGRGMAELIKRIFGEFKDTEMYVYRRTDDDAIKDFNLTQALVSHGQLVDKAHRYVFMRSLGAGLLAAAVGYASSHTPLANTQMGPIAPFAIGVATAALARKFFQAKAHYEDIANRARRIQILTTLSDMKFRNMSIAEAAFKDARSTYHAGLAGLNAMREIVDEIRYTQDAFTKNLPSLGQAES